MATLTSTGNAHGTITERDVETRPGRPPQFTDLGALKLVVQDAAKAEQWLDQKQWVLQWREAEVLYQSPRSIQAWENATTTRSNVSRFTVAKHQNALVPTVMSGIFYDSPPFVLRPRPGTSQNVTRAKTALLAALIDSIGFKTQIEKGVESQCNKGTAIFKWGYTSETKIEKKYVRKRAARTLDMGYGQKMPVHTTESDEFEAVERTVTRWKPFFEFRPLGQVLVDPGWRDANEIWKAKYVIDRQYLTFADLNKLRGQEGYDIPPEEELKALFFPSAEVAVAPGSVERQQSMNAAVHAAEGREQKTTEDPLEQPLKVDERWDSGRVMTVIQDKVLIRNEEHNLGCIPFLSSNWWNIENAGYGLGTGRMIGSDQRVEQGTINAAIDILSLSVNQQVVRNRGSNASTQQLRSRLGGIVDVDGDIDKAFRWMDPPKVPGEVWAVIQNAKQNSDSIGADEAMTQGKLPDRAGSSIGRTATGAAGIISASATKIQGPVGRLVDNVIIPFIVHLDEMVNERMPAAEIREVLGDQIEDALEVDMEEFYNARFRYEVLAGAHLAARKAMAQSLPWIITVLENPHMLDSLNRQGQTVDVKEVFDMVMEVSEWRNQKQLVRRMTDDERQMYQSTQNQVPAKLSADLQRIQAKGQVDSQLLDQRQEGDLATRLTDTAFQRAGAYEERAVARKALAPMAEGTGQYDTTA